MLGTVAEWVTAMSQFEPQWGQEVHGILNPKSHPPEASTLDFRETIKKENSLTGLGKIRQDKTPWISDQTYGEDIRPTFTDEKKYRCC